MFLRYLPALALVSLPISISLPAPLSSASASPSVGLLGLHQRRQHRGALRHRHHDLLRRLRLRHVLRASSRQRSRRGRPRRVHPDKAAGRRGVAHVAAEHVQGERGQVRLRRRRRKKRERAAVSECLCGAVADNGDAFLQRRGRRERVPAAGRYRGRVDGGHDGYLSVCGGHRADAQRTAGRERPVRRSEYIP